MTLCISGFIYQSVRMHQSVRIYRSTLGGANVIDAPSLPRATEVMPKTLFVDFATLPGAEIAGRGPHHLPNYEGLALGPTLGLRGELAGDLSVEIRGVGGLNVVRESFYDPAFGARVDPPLFNARIELALAWRVR